MLSNQVGDLDLNSRAIISMGDTLGEEIHTDTRGWGGMISNSSARGVASIFLGTSAAYKWRNHLKRKGCVGRIMEMSSLYQTFDPHMMFSYNFSCLISFLHICLKKQWQYQKQSVRLAIMKELELLLYLIIQDWLTVIMSMSLKEGNVGAF